jgi:phosphatidylserine decarboxylase
VTWKVLLAALARLPQGLLSRMTGWVADLRLPGPLRGPVNGAFARLVGVEVAEAEAPPSAHPSLGAWFARRLRPGARSWPADPAAVTSPVDGVVGAFGVVEEGVAIQAKGIDYPVAALLGDATEAAAFEGGRFLTIYLSPRHYHRIHTPTAGTVRRARAIPGRLMPVNRPAVEGVPGLFATNERLVVHLETPAGPVALVAVGAFNVGRISAAFDPGWHTNRPRRERAAPESRQYQHPVRPGAELAAFHLGSTVVLLFGPGPEGAAPPPDFAPEVTPGAELKVGTRILQPAEG